MVGVRIFSGSTQYILKIREHRTVYTVSQVWTPQGFLFSTVFGLVYLLNWLTVCDKISANTAESSLVNKLYVALGQTLVSSRVQGHFISFQPKIPEILVGWSNQWKGPFRFGLTGIFVTSSEGDPLWPVWSFWLVGPKCPSPFDKIVVRSTSLLYPAYKNNKMSFHWACGINKISNWNCCWIELSP